MSDAIPQHLAAHDVVATLRLSREVMHQLAEDRGTMPPSFVLEFATLIGFGPLAALVVAGGGALIRRQRARGAATAAATAAAAYVHQALGGTVGHLAWPFEALPIAAAILAYTIVKILVIAVVIPLVTRQEMDRAWLAAVVREGPMYFVGAALAAGFAELLAH